VTTATYIEVFNSSKQRHSHLGGVSPMVFEEAARNTGQVSTGPGEVQVLTHSCENGGQKHEDQQGTNHAKPKSSACVFKPKNLLQRQVLSR